MLAIIDRNSRRLLALDRGSADDVAGRGRDPRAATSARSTSRESSRACARRPRPRPSTGRARARRRPRHRRPAADRRRRAARARALLNLVSNAVKFTAPGGGVAITTHAVRRRVVISVRDTGSGIPAEEQDHLFTRFFRATRSQEQQVPGTGPRAVHREADRRAARRRDGRSCRRRPGSTFTMRLPLAGPPADRWRWCAALRLRRTRVSGAAAPEGTVVGQEAPVDDRHTRSRTRSPRTCSTGSRGATTRSPRCSRSARTGAGGAEMVDHVATARPATRSSTSRPGTAGVALELARRTPAHVTGHRPHARDAAIAGGRASSGRARPTAIRLVVGQAERLPFPDATFDALTFTYLLRYVADPAATLRELARVREARRRRSRASSSQCRRTRSGVRGGGVYTRWCCRPAGISPAAASGTTSAASSGRTSPRTTGATPCAGPWRRGSDAGLTDVLGPVDEPGRRPRHVGAEAATHDQRAARPSTRRDPGGWRDWWTILHPPYTAWHLSYVVHRRDARADAPTAVASRRRCSRSSSRSASPRTRSTSCTAGRCTPASRARVLVARRGDRRWPARSRSASSGVGRSRRRAPRVHGDRPGARARLQRSSSSAARLHSDVGFAAAWGAFPVLTAYFVQAGRLDLTAVARRGRGVRALARAAVASTQARLVRRRVARVDGTHDDASTAACSAIDDARLARSRSSARCAGCRSRWSRWRSRCSSRASGSRVRLDVARLWSFARFRPCA